MYGGKNAFEFMQIIFKQQLSNIYSKSPRSTVSCCFPGFPGAVEGFHGSPGVSSQKVQRVVEVSRRTLEGSRRLIFGTRRFQKVTRRSLEGPSPVLLELIRVFRHL